MSNPDDALQSAVELAADVAAAAGVPPFDVAVAVGGTGTGAEADEDNVDAMASNDDAAALAAAAAVAQASAPSGAGGPAKKRRKTGRKKENPDDVSGAFLLFVVLVRHREYCSAYICFSYIFFDSFIDSVD